MFLSFSALIVLAGAILLGTIAGALGTFAFLRRQSLLGDALAHAALPGVCIAFLVTGAKSPLPLLAGAATAGLLGALAILGIVRGSRVKEDAAMGIILSVFFGLGIVLLTYIQKLPQGNQSGLDKYLFGQAATLKPEDLRAMALLGIAAVAPVILFYPRLKVLSFDPEFGTALGLPMRGMEILLTLLLVVVVVMGLQMVGVVLMVAALVTPPAAARQWTDRLGAMIALSAGIGAVSGAVGALASATIERLPTGPSIVLTSSLALVFSLVFAPRRGLLWARLREGAATRRIRRENLLKDLYRIGEEAGQWDRPIASPVLMGVRGRSAGEMERTARDLLRRELVTREGDALCLTDGGLRRAAEILRRHRLWELYLMRRMELADDHVHRDAEAMEHALSDDDVLDLDRRLGFPATDPHGKPIPRPAAAQSTP